jgi:hypothetical protein
MGNMHRHIAYLGKRHYKAALSACVGFVQFGLDNTDAVVF